MIIQTRQYLLNGPTIEFDERNVLFFILFSKTTWIKGADKQNHQIKIRLKIRQTEEKTARWRNALILISSRLELLREVQTWITFLNLNNKTWLKLKFYFREPRTGLGRHRPILFSVNHGYLPFWWFSSLNNYSIQICFHYWYFFANSGLFLKDLFNGRMFLEWPSFRLF